MICTLPPWLVRLLIWLLNWRNLIFRNISISPVCSKKFKYWQINYMNWWRVKIFLSVWKILKFFFAWNVLKHKVKPKNSRNSTFFKKLKFPPYFWKTLVKISSPKCSPWYTVIFLSPREGKFKKNNNQLFS